MLLLLILLFLLLLPSPLLRRQSMQHDQLNCSKVWNNSFILHTYRFDSHNWIDSPEMMHFFHYGHIIRIFGTLFMIFFFSLKNMNKKWIRRIHHWFNHNIKCTLIDFYSRLTTIIRINFDIRHNGHHCKWWIVFQCDGVWCAFLSIISPNSDNSGDLHTHTNNVYTIYLYKLACGGYAYAL